MVQRSHPYMTTGKTIVLTIWTFVGKVICLLFTTLPRFVIAFLPRNNCLLISWLQSPSAVILEPEKIVCYCSHFFPIYLPWSDGTRCHDLKKKQNLFRVLLYYPFMPVGCVVMSPLSFPLTVICFLSFLVSLASWFYWSFSMTTFWFHFLLLIFCLHFHLISTLILIFSSTYFGLNFLFFF